MKTCNGCKKEKDEADFGSRWVGGRQYLRTQCRACESVKRGTRAHGKESRAASSKRQHARLRKMRADNVDTARWIVQDSRQSDKRNGRKGDIDRAFVERLIEGGCTYCGETSIRMTIDRIDNDKGHMKNNVVPACIRCNYARRSMPYEAWLVVAKGMREARDKGLFGEWTGRVR